MITYAYSVYDRKGLLYHPPFFAITDGSAVRSFTDLANDRQTGVGAHPGDYVLYRVGSYDDSSGVLLPITPAHITDALPLVREQRTFSFEDPHAGVVNTATPVNPNGKA